jgi:hypothetical protein
MSITSFHDSGERGLASAGYDVFEADTLKGGDNDLLLASSL